MSGSGSFGVNYKKTYGTDPAVVPAKLGDIGSDTDGEYMFVKADATGIAQYDAVSVASTNVVTKLVDSGAAFTTTVQVGIAQIALAANEYGWVWIGGAAGGGTGKGIKVNIASGGTTAATALYTSAATDNGKLAKTTTNHSKVSNVFALTTLAAAGTVEVQSVGYLAINP